MNTTVLMPDTRTSATRTAQVIWDEYCLAKKALLIDRIIDDRKLLKSESLTPMAMLRFLISCKSTHGDFCYMLFGRQMELIGLDGVGREIEIAENALPLAEYFVEMFGVDKAHLLGRSLANKIKGNLLEGALGL